MPVIINSPFYSSREYGVSSDLLYCVNGRTITINKHGISAADVVSLSWVRCCQFDKSLVRPSRVVQ